ncbi:MAG TPA: hypothetical protein VFG09_12855, partial [Thermodesulfovibrionales bacterium]|nr:hypothetical protein [Thermodesulfovibrionales bacterium]
MKTLVFVMMTSLVLFTVGLSSVESQTQEFEGYTIIRTVAGPQVCLGNWVQPQDVALSGHCDGQMVDL